MNRSPYGRRRNRQLVRVLELIACLQRGRMTLDELSRELSVSSRTVRRDIEALEFARLPVQKYGGGRWSDSPVVWWMAPAVRAKEQDWWNR